ncbi:hypothetical protein [Parachlamydia acanthamoebae]|uniref:Uncharacterized protein n=2 Tax=Parachlamydia acanthamoebae TaxID=83552 RepID=F8L0W1_PARAV|nr:hypothetical protein [Parachlamydia acanthamoebae]KIA77452.1 hypothetical protein DB43_GG00310 [Parachlamydia acanthamoebae]CCB86868.1 putative uncharacterized protein [Parachlamydia acanthamoebae UV-7]
MKVLIKSYSLNAALIKPFSDQVKKGKWHHWKRTFIVENHTESGYAAVTLNAWERFLSKLTQRFITNELKMGQIHFIDRSSIEKKISDVTHPLISTPKTHPSEPITKRQQNYQNSRVGLKNAEELSSKELTDIIAIFEKQKDKSSASVNLKKRPFQKNTYEAILRSMISEGEIAGYILAGMDCKIYFDRNKLPKDEALVDITKLKVFWQKVNDLRNLPTNNFSPKEFGYFLSVIEKLEVQFNERLIKNWDQAFLLPPSKLFSTQKAKVLDYLVKNKVIDAWTLDEDNWYARIDENDLIVRKPSDQWRNRELISQGYQKNVLNIADVHLAVYGLTNLQIDFLCQITHDLNALNSHESLYYELRQKLSVPGSLNEDEVYILSRMHEEKLIHAVNVIENKNYLYRIIVYPTAKSAVEDFLNNGTNFRKALWQQNFSQEEASQIHALRKNFISGEVVQDISFLSSKAHTFLSPYCHILHNPEENTYEAKLLEYKAKDF